MLTFMAKHHFNKSQALATPCSWFVAWALDRRDAVLSAWLKKMAAEVRRRGVSVGAFLLAEAGLLNEPRATTHWRFGREMAMRYPGVYVQHDPPPPVFPRASILRLPGGGRLRARVSRMKPRASWCYFCDAREDSCN